MKESVTVSAMTSPLQVLLTLIERECMDVTEVSLARVADQYLSYLGKLHDVPASILADFLVVGSRLVLLKSRTLVAASDEEDEDIEEPLLGQLRRYQAFCNAARGIQELAEANGSSYTRRRRIEEFIVFAPPADLSPSDLANAMERVLADIAALDVLPQDSIHDRVSIGEKIETLHQLLEKQASFVLQSTHNTNNDALHTLIRFLALLELVRQRKASVTQETIGGEIVVEHSERV